MDATAKQFCTAGSGDIVEQGQKDDKSQRSREFVFRLCLLVTLEAIPIKLP